MASALDGGQMVVMQVRLPLVWSRLDPGALLHPDPGAHGLARTQGHCFTRIQGPTASPGPGAQGSPGSRGPRPRPDPGPRAHPAPGARGLARTRGPGLTRLQGPAASPGPGAQGSPGSRGPRPRPDPGPRAHPAPGARGLARTRGPGLTRLQGPAASPGPGAQGSPGSRGPRPRPDPGPRAHPAPGARGLARTRGPGLTRLQGPAASPGPGAQGSPGSRGPRPRPDPGPRAHPAPGARGLAPTRGPGLTRLQGPAASPRPGAQGSPGSRGPRPRPDPGPRAHPAPGARGLAPTRGPGLTRLQGPAASPRPGAQGSPGSRGPRPRPDPGPRAHPAPGADREMAKTYVKPKEMTELVNTPSWMDKGLGSQNEMKEEERRPAAYGMLGSLAEEHDSIEEEEEEEEDGEKPKRRGPKKKKMTKARLERFKARRVKANARERTRMHGLNDALDNLRRVMPCYSKTQKLSKIETLRLARNYIWALSEVLETGQTPEGKGFVEMLCRGLSQPTSNLVAGCLQLSPQSVLLEKHEEKSPVCDSAISVHNFNYQSPGLPSPPYGHMETHLINLKPPVFKSLGESSFGNHPPDCSTPPYEGPLTPPLSISGNFSLKQDGSPDLDKSYSFMPHYPSASRNERSPGGCMRSGCAWVGGGFAAMHGVEAGPLALAYLFEAIHRGAPDGVLAKSLGYGECGKRRWSEHYFFSAENEEDKKLNGGTHSHKMAAPSPLSPWVAGMWQGQARGAGKPRMAAAQLPRATQGSARGRLSLAACAVAAVVASLGRSDAASSSPSFSGEFLCAALALLGRCRGEETNVQSALHFVKFQPSLFVPLQKCCCACSTPSLGLGPSLWGLPFQRGLQMLGAYTYVFMRSSLGSIDRKKDVVLVQVAQRLKVNDCCTTAPFGDIPEWKKHDGKICDKNILLRGVPALPAALRLHTHSRLAVGVVETNMQIDRTFTMPTIGQEPRGVGLRVAGVADWAGGTLSSHRQRRLELSVCAMVVLRHRRGLWGSELTSHRGPSKVGELGACPLVHQAFQKPLAGRRLLKGLVHQRTGTQLPQPSASPDRSAPSAGVSGSCRPDRPSGLLHLPLLLRGNWGSSLPLTPTDGAGPNRSMLSVGMSGAGAICAWEWWQWEWGCWQTGHQGATVGGAVRGHEGWAETHPCAYHSPVGHSSFQDTKASFDECTMMCILLLGHLLFTFTFFFFLLCILKFFLGTFFLSPSFLFISHFLLLLLLFSFSFRGGWFILSFLGFFSLNGLLHLDLLFLDVAGVLRREGVFLAVLSVSMVKQLLYHSFAFCMFLAASFSYWARMSLSTAERSDLENMSISTEI
ncbi:hypothetical protein QTO34_017478 [Cnephaeus nilssonii]|uniref:BHLH domain-containing protein n=2 Tax=Boreoeutheria TaxID=1437010 RepID=A0AA40I1V1_CNENI|nr:hypothetical protein QTO34_017478 [Eptesicus nilssonii]